MGTRLGGCGCGCLPSTCNPPLCSRTPPDRIRVTFLNVAGYETNEYVTTVPPSHTPGTLLDGAYHIRENVTDGVGNNIWAWHWVEGVSEPIEGGSFRRPAALPCYAGSILEPDSNEHFFWCNAQVSTHPDDDPSPVLYSQSGLYLWCCPVEAEIPNFFYYGSVHGGQNFTTFPSLSTGGAAWPYLPSVEKYSCWCKDSPDPTYFTEWFPFSTGFTPAVSCTTIGDSGYYGWTSITTAFSCDPFYLEMLFEFTHGSSIDACVNQANWPDGASRYRAFKLVFTEE